MMGVLYAIGVGPGDPELLTLKAFRILKETTCLFVPKGKEEGSSVALTIVKQVVDLSKKDIVEVHFPMIKTKIMRQCGSATVQQIEATALPLHSSIDEKWNETVKNILNKLSKGINVAFITLGDPTIYSTFFYLYDKLLELNPELSIEIIPGVSSINTAAARANLSLGLADEKIAILPATYTESIKETLERFDTIVLMKVHKVFDRVLTVLNDMGLTNKAVYVSQAGMENEKIFKNIKDIKEKDLNYFSVMIIKK